MQEYILIAIFIFRSSPDIGTYNTRLEKKFTDIRSYNSYNDGVDTSPIIKVSSLDDPSTSRRDSWDAIAKTRNILSDRSLESVANLTETQLNSDMRRSKEEEHSKFVLNEQRYHNDQSFKSNYSQSYNTYTSDNFGEKSYGRGSPSFKTTKQGGAAAVRVQPVPDGVLGQPVEFESKYQLSMLVLRYFIHISLFYIIFVREKYIFSRILRSKR